MTSFPMTGCFEIQLNSSMFILMLDGDTFLLSGATWYYRDINNPQLWLFKALPAPPIELNALNLFNSEMALGPNFAAIYSYEGEHRLYRYKLSNDGEMVVDKSLTFDSLLRLHLAATDDSLIVMRAGLNAILTEHRLTLSGTPTWTEWDFYEELFVAIGTTLLTVSGSTIALKVVIPGPHIPDFIRVFIRRHSGYFQHNETEAGFDLQGDPYLVVADGMVRYGEMGPTGLERELRSRATRGGNTR